MIERQDIGTRMSKIVKHNGTAYLCGQVGDGATVTEQTQDCLARVDALLKQAGSSRDQMLQRLAAKKQEGAHQPAPAQPEATPPASAAPPAASPDPAAATEAKDGQQS